MCDSDAIPSLQGVFLCTESATKLDLKLDKTNEICITVHLAHSRGMTVRALPCSNYRVSICRPLRLVVVPLRPARTC
jgi:hypothetical protein